MGLRARNSRTPLGARRPRRFHPEYRKSPGLGLRAGDSREFRWRTLSELLGVYADHPRQFSARFIPLERTTIVLSHVAPKFMKNSNCTTAIKNILAEANALMGYELELVPDHEYPIRGLERVPVHSPSKHW